MSKMTSVHSVESETLSSYLDEGQLLKWNPWTHAGHKKEVYIIYIYNMMFNASMSGTSIHGSLAHFNPNIIVFIGWSFSNC